MMASTTDTTRVLVVGASGFVGGYLYRRLTDEGFQTLGTQSTATSSHLLAFDLRVDRIADVLPAGFLKEGEPVWACICAALSSLEACGRDPDGSRAINVSGTIRLIDDLVNRGCRIVYFSTSAVHNGARPLYDESVPADPINEYGRQKAEVEHYVLSHFPNALVVRLSKAIDIRPAARNLFSEWHNS